MSGRYVTEEHEWPAGTSALDVIASLDLRVTILPPSLRDVLLERLRYQLIRRLVDKPGYLWLD
jgi:hypothetical protein